MRHPPSPNALCAPGLVDVVHRDRARAHKRGVGTRARALPIRTWGHTEPEGAHLRRPKAKPPQEGLKYVTRPKAASE